ncbi:MAG: hypothetical protein ACOYLS_16515, partial [Polymorphobacter sp.]
LSYTNHMGYWRFMSQTPFFPVPVQNRHDGWTPEKQRKFVAALSQTASVTQAARSVRMSVRSAHRLRQHPLAAEFRAAWDAALGQAWGRLEQVALDRAINGEREMIERNGYLVAERSKPCSDRLLIHLLNARERTQAAERAERAAAHKLALAEAKLAIIIAKSRAEVSRRRKGAPPPPPLPELPVLASDAAAETAALHAFQALGERLVPWPEMDESGAELAADIARDCTVTVERQDAADAEAAPEIPYDYETRLRWEDYRPGGKFAHLAGGDANAPESATG